MDYNLVCSLTNYRYQIAYEGPYIPTDDNFISVDILGMVSKRYHELLVKYGAGQIKTWSGYTYIFNNERDTLKAIEKLEPYLIMKKLKDV